MRVPSFLITMSACLTLAAPATAQDNLVTVAYFSTVNPQNASDFEDAAREHVEWHADQSDSQAWALYQAVTGTQARYVYIGGMPWSGLDNPSVDATADAADWVDGAGRYVDREEIRMWTQIADSGNPPADATAYPVVQVIEFAIAPGGDAAVEQGIRAYKEAIDASGADATYSWSRYISSEGPPSVFLAIFARNFAELGTPAPTPMEIVSSHVGPDQASLIGDAFNSAAMMTSSTIWTLRPDLSYLPM